MSQPSASGPGNPSADNLPLIRASELAQYSFCQRAWWLGTVKGLPAARQTSRQRGQQQHQRHGRQVLSALFWRRAGLVLLGTGGLLLIAALLGLWFF